MTITIYSTSTCTYCHALADWLDEEKVAYTKVVIDKEPDGMAQFMAVNEGVITVPLTLITDNAGTVTRITGFDKDAFKKVLAK